MFCMGVCAGFQILSADMGDLEEPVPAIVRHKDSTVAEKKWLSLDRQQGSPRRLHLPLAAMGHGQRAEHYFDFVAALDMKTSRRQTIIKINHCY